MVSKVSSNHGWMLDRFSNIRHFYTIFVVSTVRGIIYPVHCTRAAAAHICTFFGRSRSLALQYPISESLHFNGLFCTMYVDTKAKPKTSYYHTKMKKNVQLQCGKSVIKKSHWVLEKSIHCNNRKSEVLIFFSRVNLE